MAISLIHLHSSSWAFFCYADPQQNLSHMNKKIEKYFFIKKNREEKRHKNSHFTPNINKLVNGYVCIFLYFLHFSQRISFAGFVFAHLNSFFGHCAVNNLSLPYSLISCNVTNANFFDFFCSLLPFWCASSCGFSFWGFLKVLVCISFLFFPIFLKFSRFFDFNIFEKFEFEFI